MSEFQMPCFERRGMKEDQWLDVKSQESQGCMCIILVFLYPHPRHHPLLFWGDQHQPQLCLPHDQSSHKGRTTRHDTSRRFVPKVERGLSHVVTTMVFGCVFRLRTPKTCVRIIWKNICTWQITYLMQVVLFSRLPKWKKNTTILSRAFYLMSCNFNYHN